MKRSYNGYQPFRTLATFHFDHPHSLPLAFYVSPINKKLPEISKALLKKEVGELAGGEWAIIEKARCLACPQLAKVGAVTSLKNISVGVINKSFKARVLESHL